MNDALTSVDENEVEYYVHQALKKVDNLDDESLDFAQPGALLQKSGANGASDHAAAVGDGSSVSLLQETYDSSGKDHQTPPLPSGVPPSSNGEFIETRKYAHSPDTAAIPATTAPAGAMPARGADSGHSPGHLTTHAEHMGQQDTDSTRNDSRPTVTQGSRSHVDEMYFDSPFQPNVQGGSNGDTSFDDPPWLKDFSETMAPAGGGEGKDRAGDKNETKGGMRFARASQTLHFEKDAVRTSLYLAVCAGV